MDDVVFERRMGCVAVGLLWSLFPGIASAHGGQPAYAPLTSIGPCVRVADRALLRWTEPPFPSVFGESQVEISWTRSSTRPLYPRELPLTPWTVIHSVSDADLSDRFLWNTSTVAEGHYFLWSRIVEPPEESADFVAQQAAFVVTVERESRPLGPTVFLIRPASQSISFGEYRLSYVACDPTGTARVRIEAAPAGRPDEYVLIAEDLPAVESATVTWNTRGLEAGDWFVRARISDECGHVFESHARSRVTVAVPLDPYDAGPRPPAAGPLDARTGGGEACRGRPDAEMDPDVPLRAADAGADRVADGGTIACASAPCPTDDGCGCATVQRQGGSMEAVAWMMLFGVAVRRLRRWR